MDFTIQNNKDTRSGFGEGLLEAGRRNPKVVAFCADLTPSVKMGDFAKEFPDRFFQTGIAEANMIDMAAGMALSGFVPFTGTFAACSTGRVYDQIRQCVAYSNKNVKIAASHAGVTLGEDGHIATFLQHLSLADDELLIHRGEIRHFRTTKTQVHRTIVFGSSNGGIFGLVEIARHDDRHVG